VIVRRISIVGMLVLGACSSNELDTDAPDAQHEDVDAGVSVDANLGCSDPSAVLPIAWRSINAVSTGQIEPLNVGSAYVDGSAGGIQNAADNPYIYLRFGSSLVEKVEITDTEARSSDQWDLAIKRMVFLSNGGDSGQGGRSIAPVSAATVEEVDSAPSEASFWVDDWVTDDCEFISGQIGEPASAVGTWYEYDLGTSRLTPKDTVFVLQRPDSSLFKFKIETYYYGDKGSAHYELHWAPL